MGCGCSKKKKNVFVNAIKTLTGQSSTQTTSEPNDVSSFDILSETDPLYLQRVSICNSCEFKDAEKEKCGACGCFIKAKARLSLSKCPLEQPRW
jgi:hypothetical protein